jgi:hypothetical protein
MKNLNDMGVVELKQAELQEIEGGGFWQFLLGFLTTSWVLWVAFE